MERSAFENVWSLFNNVPQGHEKALKQALYNAIALLMVTACAAATWGLFLILDPFLRPLIWALLIGSVLHPFKHWVERHCLEWFNRLDNSSDSLFIASLLLPISVIDKISEFFGSYVKRYLRILLLGCVSILTIFLLYTYSYISFIGRFWDSIGIIFLFFLNNLTSSVFFTILTGYIGLLFTCWNERTKIFFYITSYIIWFLIGIYIIRWIGFLVLPLCSSFLVSMIVGFGYQSHLKSCGRQTFWHALKTSLFGYRKDQSQEVKATNTSEKHAETFQEGTSFRRLSKSGKATFSKERRRDFSIRRNSSCQELKNDEEISRYMTAVAFCCFLILLWKYSWVRHLLPIPVAFYVTKHLGWYFGIWNIFGYYFAILTGLVEDWIKLRENALFPMSLQGLFNLSENVRLIVIKNVKGYISPVASALVILCLISFLFLFTTFLSLQIYAEGIHLLTMGASIINSTVVSNPEFLQLLPNEITNTVESVLENAYIYGREGISKKIRTFMKDIEPSKVDEIEKHVLEFWDRVYQAWLMAALEKHEIGPKVSTSAVVSSWEKIVDTLQKTPDLLNLRIMMEFAKDNLDTLMSLLDSVYSVLKENISLVFHFGFAMVSLILGGGSAVLNLLISVIVFFTALFYLLTSSTDVYKPVELISGFSPISGNKLGLAFEAAVNGVFCASFKMALFYGLWTWIVHNLFAVRIVYLPSVLAAALGAVPFFGTYWASIPAVLDLWVAQNQGILAFLLFVTHCLPMSFVDAAIYAEIKGGAHPYMTGLAIAGGVFCMGIQGAIFGPLLLCCLLVALNMSSSLMKDSPVDANIDNKPVRHLRRMDTVM